MILYGSSMSPFVRKVLAFAAEQGTEIELKASGLGSTDPDFLRASPFRKMPALTDGDYTLADSSAIVHYLDALDPAATLIPTEPRARGKTIWFDECFSTASCRPVFSGATVTWPWPTRPSTTSCRRCSITLKPKFPPLGFSSRTG